MKSPVDSPVCDSRGQAQWLPNWQVGEADGWDDNGCNVVCFCDGFTLGLYDGLKLEVLDFFVGVFLDGIELGKPGLVKELFTISLPWHSHHSSKDPSK